jgi:hypothetical protein
MQTTAPGLAGRPTDSLIVGDTPGACKFVHHCRPLVASEAPHERQRYPGRAVNHAHSSDPLTPNRYARVMRWADKSHAQLDLQDQGISIGIELDAARLRQLAADLLDAAHDIEVTR